MNLDQFLGILRVVLPVVLPILTAKGIVPVGATADISSAIVALGAAGWSWIAHTDSAKIAAAAALPGVAKLAAFSGIPASAKIAAVAALPDVKKIVTKEFPIDPAVAAAASDPSQTKVAPAP